jgi:hypothetical protein
VNRRPARALDNRVGETVARIPPVVSVLPSCCSSAAAAIPPYGIAVDLAGG